MRIRLSFNLAVLALALALAACSTPPPRPAQAKTVQVQGKKLELGGVYEPKPKLLRITVNGDPILQGSFSSFSPTLTLNAKIDGIELTAQCYFGSILGSRGGIAGIVANSVQGGVGKSSDSCEMKSGDKTLETLYF